MHVRAGRVGHRCIIEALSMHLLVRSVVFIHSPKLKCYLITASASRRANGTARDLCASTRTPREKTVRTALCCSAARTLLFQMLRPKITTMLYFCPNAVTISSAGTALLVDLIYLFPCVFIPLKKKAWQLWLPYEWPKIACLYNGPWLHVFIFCVCALFSFMHLFVFNSLVSQPKCMYQTNGGWWRSLDISPSWGLETWSITGPRMRERWIQLAQALPATMQYHAVKVLHGNNMITLFFVFLLLLLLIYISCT